MGTEQSKSAGKPLLVALNGHRFDPPPDFGRVEFEVKPFGEGACRLAYRGAIEAQGQETVTGSQGWFCWRKSPANNAYPCVVKLFKTRHAMQASEWRQDLGLLVKCNELASIFNGSVTRDGQEITFASPVIYSVDRVGFIDEKISPEGALGGGVAGLLGGGALAAAAEGGLLVLGPLGAVVGAVLIGAASARGTERAKCRRGERVCIEPFLDGDFQKLNSNTGWIWRQPVAEVGQAFSHWTWHYTNGQMLVCDLQGTRSSHGWLLTDPAAHSPIAGKLGPTDCGQRGIDTFFHTHTCTSLCRGFRKPASRGSPFRVRRSTTFSFQLNTLA